MNKAILSIVILSSSLIFFACSKNSLKSQIGGYSDSGIINGKPVSEKDPVFFMTVRLLRKLGDVWYPYCTASILSKDLILTAAHCVSGVETAEEMRIGFGVQPLTFEGQSEPETRVDVLAKFKTVPVSNFEIHTEYGTTDYDHDIALLRMNGALPEGYKAASLMSDKTMTTIKEDQNYKVLLVGYGLYKEDPMTESDVLRQTEVPAKFEGMHVVTDQTKDSGGCHGDSGGPAYLTLDGTMYLVGVTHGPKLENVDCHHNGVWGNPNFDKEFLNKAAEKMGSATRF